MTLHGIVDNLVVPDAALAAALPADAIERYRVVPKTVMINPWQPDLAWITLDATYPSQIRERHALLLRHRDMLIDRIDADPVRAAEVELLTAVVDDLLACHPAYFRREGRRVVSLLTGFGIDVEPGGADPLVALALLSSEDMLLLLPDAAAAAGKALYRLQSGALLFPNDWLLRSHFHRPAPDDRQPEAMRAWEDDKRASERAARLGKTPLEIHDGRVAHYMAHFADRVDLFFRAMKPGMRTWRRNWAIKMTDRLCLHPDLSPPPQSATSPEDWAAHGCLRVEQQTFAKLPQSGAVVFGIKTYVWKLSEVVRNPLALEALLIAHDNLAPGMFDYRKANLLTFREFLARHRR